MVPIACVFARVGAVLRNVLAISNICTKNHRCFSNLLPNHRATWAAKPHTRALRSALAACPYRAFRFLFPLLALLLVYRNGGAGVKRNVG